MNWGDLFDVLERERKLLGAKYPHWTKLATPGDLADQYVDLIFERGPTIDVVVTDFCKTGTWPELSAQDGAALLERFEFAVGLAIAFDELRATVPGPRSRQEKLEWILNRAWHAFGAGQIHSTLESLECVGSAENPNAKN